MCNAHNFTQKPISTLHRWPCSSFPSRRTVTRQAGTRRQKKTPGISS